MNKKFLKDLDSGKEAENKVKELLLTAGINSEKSVGKNSDYDFAHNNGYTSEVKFDIFAAKSGNIAIEFYNPRSCKPSGIDATKADLWFHVITKPNSIWLTSVRLLKQFILDNKPYRIVSCGGDNNASMYLYKQDIIFPAIFVRIDNLPPLDIQCIINNMLQTSLNSNKRGDL